jgi:tetratricopeptide (TPR) repeat protein
MALVTLFKWLMFFGILYAGVCSRVEKDEHPEYYGKYIDTLSSNYDRATGNIALHSYQIAMQRFPVGIMDKVNFFRYQASFFRSREEFKNAFISLDSIDQLVKGNPQKKYVVEYVKNQFAKSECYLALKNYDAVMNCLLDAKTVINNNKDIDHCEYTGYNQRLAGILYSQGRYKLAIDYFRKAMADALECDPTEIGKFEAVQRNLDNIGMAYAQIGIYDSAYYYYKATLEYVNKREHEFPKYTAFMPLARAVAYGNMAKIKRVQKLYAEAEQLSMDAIAITKDVYSNIPIDSQFELVNLYMDWGKLNKAKQVLHALDSVNHFRDSTFDQNSTFWHLAMEKLWAKMGDTVKAFQYNERYLAIRDSLDKNRTTNLARDMEMEIAHKEQAVIKTGLERKNKATSMRLTIFFILIVLAAITGLFVCSNLKRAARQEKLLEALNVELELKKKDLEETFVSLQQIQRENGKITRIVAHDLKNPVGGIRNLLYSFVKKQEPGEVRNALESMSADCDTSIAIINQLVKEIPPDGKANAEIFAAI